MSFYSDPQMFLQFAQNYSMIANWSQNYPQVQPIWPEHLIQNLPFYTPLPSNQSYPIKEEVHILQSNVTRETNAVPEVAEKPKQPKREATRKQKKNEEKEISSAKKNSQSNIINQFYSFFGCRDKSEKLASRAVLATLPETEDLESVLNLFYSTIRLINSMRGRNYVNRSMLLNYFTPEILLDHIPNFTARMEGVDYVTLDELCQIFRRCCQAFLKIVSVPAIMTSKRITGLSKEEHFKKRRKIIKAITGY